MILDFSGAALYTIPQQSLLQNSDFSPSVAGILGYAAGKASYAGTCRGKFKEIGLGDGPGFGPGFGPWSEGRRGGPFKNSGHGHRWVVYQIFKVPHSCLW